MSSSTDSANNIIACVIAIAILAASYIYMFGRRGEVVKADNVSRVMTSTDNANTDNKGGDITTTTASNEKAENTNNITTCANCGKGEEESVHLKNCNGCFLLKYCNRDCQIAHRPQHKKACKKRAAELYEERLFKDPPPREECPICMIPLPVDGNNEIFKSCCGKFICRGCWYEMTNESKKKGKKFKEDLCAFCRAPEFSSDKELIKRLKSHMEKGNADAISYFGALHIQGHHGFPQDYAKANELFLKAGELGCSSAYYNLAKSYEHGLGVEIDKKKAKYYNELSSMMGNLNARCFLGASEVEEGKMGRAYKHFMVSARAGHTVALDVVKKGFMHGHVTKEEYAETLRTYQNRHMR